MQAVTMLGGLGFMLVSFFGSGLPLGVPPDKEDPIMAHVAPDDCVLYATWAARATPSAASSNQTEQLLAEPEVQKFVEALQRNVLAAGIAAAKKNGGPPEQVDKVGKAVALWVRTLFTKSGALYVSRLAPRGNQIDVQAALIVKANETAAELDQSLTDMLTMGGASPTEVTLVGRKFHKLALPAAEPIDFVWSAGNGYLLVGFGGGAMEEMSNRIRAQKEPAWLAQVKSNLPVERRSTVSYVNIKKLIDTFLPLGGPEAEKVVNTLGLKQITSFQSVSGLDKSGLFSRSLLSIDGPASGLLKLLDEKGIDTADLKHIPADSVTAFAFVLDLRKVYDLALSAIGEIDPGAAEQAKQTVAQTQGLLGINLPETLSALGSHWSLHVPTADGGALATAVVIEVRNKNRLLDLEKNLLSRFANQAGDIPNVGRISRSSFAGQTITSLTPRTPNIFVPTWCVTDSKLIIGINPQAIKSILGRQAGEKSLAELPEIASPLAAANLVGANGPLVISYYDTPRSFAAMYAQAQVVAPMLNSMAQQAGIPFDLDVAQLPAQRTIAQHLRPSVTTIRRTARGLESESRQTFPGLSVGASSGVAVALLLPAVQAAREAARRMQSSNHIKQQLLSLQNYHDVYGALPPAYTVSKDGKPLLSWRVAILPFVEQRPMFEQFHLDEPWDSEHNKQFLGKMPMVFRSPNSSAKPGMTTYLGVGGPRGVIGPQSRPGTNKGIPMSAVIDGTSNTIAIVEASDELAVDWTKPEEWTPDQKDPFKGLLGMRPNGFLAGFVDGHTTFIPKSLAPEMLRNLFSRDDGNTIVWPEDRPPPRPGVAPPPGKALPPPKAAPGQPRS